MSTLKVDAIEGYSGSTVTITGFVASGVLKAADGAVGAPGYSFSDDSDTGIYRDANGLNFTVNGSFAGRIDTSGNFLVNNALLLTGSQDVQLHRDAAAALAQRNGANAQVFRVYGMFTDASNYGRVEVGALGTIDGAANRYGVIARSSGTGSVTNIDFGTMDPGSLSFVTSGLHRWYFDSSGHFKAIDDNTYDIGASGANRPRDVHIARDLNVSRDFNVGSAAVVTGSISAAQVAVPAGGTAGLGLKFSTSAENLGVFFGSGAPTLSAGKGSLYLRTDGSGTGDRAYINTNGGTTWTALTTAA